MTLKDPEKYAAYQKKWREENKEYLREYNKQYRQKNKERITNNSVVYHREQLQSAKQELYLLLGNACNRCGFSDERAFQLHHVNRDGHKIRKKFRNLKYIHYMIDEVKVQITSEITTIELLCANCHAVEHFDDRTDGMKRISKNLKNVEGRPGKTKLTEQQVRNIRKKSKDGASISELVREYGVVKNTVRYIIDGISWRWVK